MYKLEDKILSHILAGVKIDIDYVRGQNIVRVKTSRETDDGIITSVNGALGTGVFLSNQGNFIDALVDIMNRNILIRNNADMSNCEHDFTRTNVNNEDRLACTKCRYYELEKKVEEKKEDIKDGLQTIHLRLN